ncbi:hypothetical protein ACY2DA_00430 [Staphylococcus simulans]
MKMLRKTIFKEFKASLPRFISIAILLALGTFVLIGLKVTGDDMRLTGNDYFKEHKMAHAQATSPVGFNQEDKDYIDHMKHVKKTEYSVYKDAVVSDSKKTMRLNENTSKLSIYKAVDGHLPKKDNEIALSNEEKDNYKIGDTFKLENSKGDKDISGLKHSEYKIVGFVTSSDYMQKHDLGMTDVGKGQIDTFAVLDKSGFSDTTPNVAKLTYDNVKGKSYSDKFEKQLQDNVDQNTPGLAKWADQRESDIKDEKRNEVKDGREKLDKEKEKIDQKEKSLNQSKEQLDQSESQLKDAKQQLSDAKKQADQLPAGVEKEQMTQQLQAQQQQVDEQEKEFNSKQKE